MPETCENWLGLANSCVYYVRQTHEIYQVLLCSEDFKAPPPPPAPPGSFEIHWVNTGKI